MIKKFLYIFIISMMFTFSGCNENNSITENSEIGLLKIDNTSQQIELPTFFVEHGSLTSEEKGFFSQIALTPDFPFIYENEVIRYYKIENGKKENILNTIVFSKKDGVIVSEKKETPYVYYDLNFTGDSGEMIINFKFSQGTGYHGNGSIIKYGDEIIKSYIACGEICSKEVIK